MIEGGPPKDLSADAVWDKLRSALHPFVSRRVAMQDTEDVLQEIFVRIARGLPTLQDDQRFGPWVYQVARSAIADHCRSAARHPVRELSAELTADPTAQHSPSSLFQDDPVSPVAPHRSLEDDVNLAQQVAGYAALFVQSLPSPYREALTLTELEGLSQAQAARNLEISVSGMKSRVQRGRKMVREALQQCCDIALDARHKVVDCTPRRNGKPPEGCCQ